ncbi:MAG: GDYXXLXY domain-containing protein [Akkermansia sp.]|nr:GDYXXLXY domain-containing protein [Akkermansia sp.]
MNKIAFSLLVAVLLGQLSWLGYSYHARVQEMAASPRILLAVKPYDPRDLFRGDYLSLDMEEEIPLTSDEPRLGKSLYWVADSVSTYRGGERIEIPYPAREKQTEGATLLRCWWDSHDGNFIAFVRPDAEGVCHLSRVESWGSSEDVCREGERRLPAPMRAYITSSRTESSEEQSVPVCCVSLRRALRYYVPEKKGNLPGIAWNAPAEKKVLVTMECVLRERNGLIPVQLFVDGVPYLEAYEKWVKEHAGK